MGVIDHGRLKEDTARRYFADCVGGLQHVHKNGWSHGDLSLENLLLDDQDKVVITDFGLCCKWTGRDTDRVGKGFYLSPEVFAINDDDEDTQTYDAYKADVWSLGVILFMLITGVPPAESPCESDRRFCLVKSGQIKTMVKSWRMEHLFSEDAMDLVTRMLKVDPNERISLEEIIEHPWIEDLIELNTAPSSSEPINEYPEPECSEPTDEPTNEPTNEPTDEKEEAEGLKWALQNLAAKQPVTHVFRQLQISE